MKIALNQNIKVDGLEQMLVEEFSSALGRPLKPGELTPHEIQLAHIMDERLRAIDFLNLHSDTSIKPLKISARVSIRFESIQVDGQPIRATLVVCDSVIADALLESDSSERWRAHEFRLRGVPFVDWRNYF